MRIYTGRGDKGETDLRNGDRVSKASKRIEAYGNVDEANAFIGYAASALQHEDVAETLRSLQNDLFKAQADLADPEGEPRITAEDVDWVEEECDKYSEELEPLDSFILPGGSPAGSRLHLARTVTRRAERRIVALQEDAGVDPVLKYMNRASDLLFILGRVVNQREGMEERNPSY